MRYPKLEPEQAQRETVDTFLGYHNAARIAEGEFAAMENLTSDRFPLLSTRRTRGTIPGTGKISGLIARDSLCYVEGSRFVMNGYGIELGLSDAPGDCPKQLVAMGAYVIIFPDKKYINTLDVTDFGNLEAAVQAQNVVCTPCDAEGTPMLPAYIQPEEPESPGAMALWLDSGTGTLLQWSAGSGMWVPVETTYVKLAAQNIGLPFREGDGVLLAGQPEGIEANAVIRCRGEDYLVLPGLIREQTTAQSIAVSRTVPRMDYIIECENRLWGCRYGMNAAGQTVNEIYASKLGDFRNWNCFEGVSTDSYAVSLGADGPFTGAIAHLGYPLFFRETCMHKIYGSYPAGFRLQTTPCRGVQRGSSGSLAIVGEVLYYKSPHGVCACDGSLPVEVGQALGLREYTSAAAGAHRGKYYLSMADAGGTFHLFVLDTAKNLWHREDSTRATAFCSCREELYFLDGEGKLRTVFGTGTPEEKVHFLAETGDIGGETAMYLSRLTLRFRLAKGGQMTVAVRYDEEPVWHTAAQLRSAPMGCVTLPLTVRRCDHLRLRLEGFGELQLYSLTKTVTQGSDVF